MHWHLEQLQKTIIDLNSYDLGFEVTFSSKEKNGGSYDYYFEIIIKDADKYQLLLNL